MKIIKGDLIALANQGHFEVITHGCNCFCTMGAGIAVPMKQNFKCDQFPMESLEFKGDINKLGTIDYMVHNLILNKPIKLGNLNLLAPDFGGFPLIVVNSYTQYRYGWNHVDGDKKPVDYEAITLCMRKINHEFKGKSIGLPKIGCGLAGGDWNIVSKIFERELKDMDVTVVELHTNRFQILVAIFADTMDELRVKMIGFYHDHCYHYYFGPVENVPLKLKWLISDEDKKFVFIFEEAKPIQYDTQIQNTEN